MIRLVLMAAVLFSGLSAHAGVYGGKYELFKSRNIDVCWWGGSSASTSVLRQKIEHYVVTSVEATGAFSFNRGWPACENLSAGEAGRYVGVLIYDDPIFEDKKVAKSLLEKNEYFDFYVFDHEKTPGHPRAEGKGRDTEFKKFDLILTSRFGSVAPALIKQAAALTPAGQENLILTIALHEMMHVFGAAHEHTHPESDCIIKGDEPVSFNRIGMTFPSAYDKSSIMNSCRTRAHDYESGPAGLSAGDVQTLVDVYSFLPR